MKAEHLFERNMLAITSCQKPDCAAKIFAAKPDSRIGITNAKDGLSVPYIDIGGRRAFLHSRFEPQKEARRIAAAYTKTGFYVFMGLGAGYEILEFLSSDKVTEALIIEYGAEITRALLERIDLTHILGDSRCTLLVDPSDAEIESAISEHYIPAIAGDFIVAPLRGRCDSNPHKYAHATETIRETLTAISDDYSVQSFFGKRWFRNILRNISAAEKPTKPIGLVSQAIVTAAGPSLENYIPAIKQRGPSTFLIATDTSLRALLINEIIPDAVISIDCQHISYQHFLVGLPQTVPLFLDLASPPTISRLSREPYFFSSGHPFALYVASRMRAFPVLNTSGGNVTHAAVSLADYLGAQTIYIYGADFSYPQGKSYARGTYLYQYFDALQSRCKPFETLFSDFLYRSQTIERKVYPDGTFSYATKPLTTYERRLQKFCSGLSCEVLRVCPHQNFAYSGKGSNSGTLFASGPVLQKPLAFLQAYKTMLQKLPEPTENASLYIKKLSAHEKDILMTILPSAAAFRRGFEQRNNSAPQAYEMLISAKNWCERLVSEELSKLYETAETACPKPPHGP